MITYHNSVFNSIATITVLRQIIVIVIGHSEEGPLETNNERDPNEILGNVAALFSDNSLNIRRRSANGVYVTARSKAASSRFASFRT